MKNKKFNKTKIAILSALFISSSIYAATEKYIFVLDNKGATYAIGGDVQNPDNGGSNPTPPADPDAGTEKPVPVEGYDYANFDVGTYSSFLRAPDQTTVFGSGETFTYNTEYNVSGSVSGSTENEVMYLELVGFKTIYNFSSYQLTVSAIEPIDPSLSLEAQKSGNDLSAVVQEGYTINYNSSSDVINLNGSQANGTKVFNADVNLYMNYSGDADNGTFTFENPTPLNQGTHSTINYTSGDNIVHFTNDDLLSFRSGTGFQVSPSQPEGGSFNTLTNTYYNSNATVYEGVYSFNSGTNQITYSAPMSFSNGTYEAMRDSAIDFGLPTVFLKLDAVEYIKIQFNGSSVLTDANDSAYDCIDPSSCSVGGRTITYDSGNNVFNIN